jgi:hypothetical protein
MVGFATTRRQSWSTTASRSAAAPAAAVAGDGIVGVGAGDTVQRCFNASPRVLAEVVIDLVPVLPGEGIRTAVYWSTADRVESLAVADAPSLTGRGST